MTRFAALASLAVLAGCGRPMSVEVTPGSVQVALGATVELTVKVLDAPAPVTLSLEGAPEGVTIAPASLPANGTLHTVTLSAAATAKSGRHTVRVSVGSKGQTVAAPLELEVIDRDAFAFTLSPRILIVRQGQVTSATFTVKANPMRTADGPVAVTVEGQAAGLELTADPVTLNGDAARSGTLKVTASATAAPGSSTFKLLAAQGSLRAELPFQVTVLDASAPSFTLQAPPMLSVRRSGQTSFQVRVAPTMGFSDTVTVRASGLPVGVSMAEAVATPASPAQVSLVAAPEAAAGMFMFTVTGTSGVLVNELRIAVRVTETGSVDSTFGHAGLASGTQLTQVNRMTVLDDGKIVLCGSGPQGATVVRLTADGEIDGTFGLNGVVVIPVAGTSPVAAGVAKTSSGGVVVAAYAIDNTTFEYNSVLARLNADGTRDTTFGVQGTYTDPLGAVPFDVIPLANGGVLVSSTSYEIAGTSFSMSATFSVVTAAGALDVGFGTGGAMTVVDAIGTAAVVLSQGGYAVMVATMNAATGEMTDPRAIRLTSGGEIDTTFGTLGVIKFDLGMANQLGYGLASRADGSLLALVMGYANSMNPGGAKSAVFQLTPAGAADMQFGTAGKTELAMAAPALELTADGSVLVGGCEEMGTMSYSGRVARLGADGQVDDGFAAQGSAGAAVAAGQNACVFSVHVQPSGRIVAAGNLGSQMTGGAFITRLMP